MRVSLIVAVSENGVIGRDNDLPWHLSADLRRFKSLTMDHHLLVGRKTFEAIGRPLPGRRMVVISKGRPVLPEGVDLVSSPEEGIELARGRAEREVFIAGGAQIYRRTLPLADRLYLTRIHQEFDGDATFPELAAAEWTLVEQLSFDPDPDQPLAYSFLTLDRV